MWVLVVLVILLLGYRINSQVDEKSYKLKRSIGWVSYVILAADGAISLGIAFCVLMIIYVLFLAIGSLIDLSLLNLGVFENHIHKLLEEDYIKFLFSLMLLVSSLATNEIRLNIVNAVPDLNALKKLDGMVNILLTALENSSYLKICLNTGKVYIGIIVKEEFIKGEGETLTIVPMLSGYRNKDNLQLHLDCNYLNVYLKHGVVKKIPEGICYNEDEADFVSMLIPVSEIVSISFFDINKYEDFEYENNAAIKFRELQQPDAQIISDITYKSSKTRLINK